jgi:hypothetical protein
MDNKDLESNKDGVDSKEGTKDESKSGTSSLNEELEVAKLRAKLKKSQQISQEERNVYANQLAKSQRDMKDEQNSLFLHGEEDTDYAALRRSPSIITKTVNTLFFGGLLTYIIVYILYKKKVKRPNNSKCLSNL